MRKTLNGVFSGCQASVLQDAYANCLANLGHEMSKSKLKLRIDLMKLNIISLFYYFRPQPKRSPSFAAEFIGLQPDPLCDRIDPVGGAAQVVPKPTSHRIGHSLGSRSRGKKEFGRGIAR